MIQISPNQSLVKVILKILQVFILTDGGNTNHEHFLTEKQANIK